MASRVIEAAEPLYVVLITPLLLFPTLRPTLTAIALAGLILLWLLRAIVRREPWPATPFNVALLLFCLAIPLAVWASAVPELTIPKLTGLILGLAAFRAVAFCARNRRGLAAVLVAFAALGLAMWALGLLGIRLAVLAPLLQRLPPALVSLPGASDQGINPNQLAGVLMLYLPFLLAGVLFCLRQRRSVAAVLLSAATLAAAATLVLTRSRAGWIGASVALVTLGVTLVLLQGSRRVKRVVLAVAGMTLVAGLIGAAVLLPHWFGAASNSAQSDQQVGEVLQQLSLDARIEIWSRALYALQDFPFTGVGLGTFRRVVNLLYPLFLVPPDTDIAHAHNIFLQVGVDLGLGGLIAYIALLLIACISAWHAARAGDLFSRLLSLGLLAALVGLHVYGLADALALGSKPGIALWMVLGLLAALVRAQPAAALAARESSATQRVVEGVSTDAAPVRE